eukprot:687838-Alexandrium_andersonii.AAC.2
MVHRVRNKLRWFATVCCALSLRGEATAPPGISRNHLQCAQRAPCFSWGLRGAVPSSRPPREEAHQTAVNRCVSRCALGAH